MTQILTYEQIDRTAWSTLVRESRTGTWFQSPEAYGLFASLPDLFRPFAIGVERVNELTSERVNELTNERINELTNERINELTSERINELTDERRLRGVCVGYVTKERSVLRQYFTRRAIILGGPCLADDCSDAEITALLEAVKTKTRHLSPIYIETRNFNDYSRWKGAFEKARFAYKPHLNFHIDCRDKAKMWERLSDTRKRQIRRVMSERINELTDERMNELTSERINELTSERVSEEEIREWYAILERLYRTKVKTPLWPEEFFLEAHRQGAAKYLLVRHEGKVVGGMMIVTSERVNELTNERMNELTSERINELTNGGCIYEWYICGLDAEYKEQYPSVMATWAAMEYANQHGLARFDVMGAGEPGVPYGVRDFKAEFGGELVEHGRYLCVLKPMLYKLGTIGVKILKKQKKG